MATSYNPYYSGGWQSGEEGGTPITPDALNHIEDGIAGAYDYTEQSTASVSSISFISETTWGQIYAKLKSALNDQNRTIALITVYSGTISNLLTANNYGGYLKGYVTM